MKTPKNTPRTSRTSALVFVIGLVFPAAVPAATQEVELREGINYVGLQVAGPVISACTVTAVTTGENASITVSGSVPTDLSRQYSIECQNGFWSPCLSWNESTRTVSVRLLDTEAAPAVGQACIIRRALNISEIFGTGSAVQLTKGPIDEADVVRVRRQEEWITVHHTSGANGQWALAGSPASAANVPVFFPQVLVIERRSSTPLTLTFSGESRTWPVVVSLADPLLHWTTDDDADWTVVAVPGTPLVASSGLGSGSGNAWSPLTAAETAAGADALLLPAPGGNLRPVFLKPDGTWAEAGGAELPTAEPMPSAVIIERRSTGTPQRVRLNP